MLDVPEPLEGYALYLMNEPECYGEYPARADELLDGYLDTLPADPFGGGEPIEFDPPGDDE